MDTASVVDPEGVFGGRPWPWRERLSMRPSCHRFHCRKHKRATMMIAETWLTWMIGALELVWLTICSLFLEPIASETNFIALPTYSEDLTSHQVASVPQKVSLHLLFQSGHSRSVLTAACRQCEFEVGKKCLRSARIVRNSAVCAASEYPRERPAKGPFSPEHPTTLGWKRETRKAKWMSCATSRPGHRGHGHYPLAPPP